MFETSPSFCTERSSRYLDAALGGEIFVAIFAQSVHSVKTPWKLRISRSYGEPSCPGLDGLGTVRFVDAQVM